MKLKIFLLFIWLFIALNAKTQEFNFGLMVGFDLTAIDVKRTGNPEIYSLGFNPTYPVPSFNFNGYFQYKSDGVMGVSIEPGFIQKGGRAKNVDYKPRFQFNYIQLPILVEFYLSDRIFLSTGTELGYLLNAKMKANNNSGDVSQLYENKFELSGVLGINYNFNEIIGIGLRYSHGISYTSSFKFIDIYGNEIGESKEYNQYFQLFVRYKL